MGMTMDAVDRSIRERMDLYKPLLVEAAKDLHCPRCGQPTLPVEPEGWISPRDLKDQVNGPLPAGESSCVSLALSELIHEGVFERNTRWRVRLAKDEQ